MNKVKKDETKHKLLDQTMKIFRFSDLVLEIPHQLKIKSIYIIQVGANLTLQVGFVRLS